MRPDQSPKHAAADNDNSSAADSDTSNTATLGPILTRQIDEEFLKLGGHDSILSAVDIKAITNDILDNVVARTFRGMKGIPPLVQQRCRDQVQALANGKRKNQILLESNKPHTNEVPAPNPSPSKKPAAETPKDNESDAPNQKTPETPRRNPRRGTNATTEATTATPDTTTPRGKKPSTRKKPPKTTK